MVIQARQKEQVRDDADAIMSLSFFLRFPHFHPTTVRASVAANSNTAHCLGAGHTVQGKIL